MGNYFQADDAVLAAKIISVLHEASELIVTAMYGSDGDPDCRMDFSQEILTSVRAAVVLNKTPRQPYGRLPGLAAMWCDTEFRG